MIIIPEHSRYDVNFRVGWIPVRVTPRFWICQSLPGVLAAILFSFASHPNETHARIATALLIFLMWLLCAYTSILVHELGHVLVGAWFGARGEIVLTGFGGLALGSADLTACWQRVTVHLAGPLAQLPLAGIAATAVHFLDSDMTRDSGPRMVVALGVSFLVWINLAWPIFNLIPVPPLDGGRILQDIIQWARSGSAPSWQRDPNWWKRGISTSEWHSSDCDERSSLISRLLPWLVASTILVLGVWWMHDSNQRSSRREAHARLTQLGAVFGWDGRDTLYGIRLHGQNVGDAEVALLRAFDGSPFDNVDLSRTGITDQSLPTLSKLSGLRMLYLHDTAVGDEGLKYVDRLKNLEVLHLAGTQVTDQGLEQLQHLQKLEWLSLSRTAVTDAGIKSLKRLKRLLELHVHDTEVTADGAAALQHELPTIQINLHDRSMDR
jgi:Zn-dependent protease